MQERTAAPRDRHRSGMQSSPPLVFVVLVNWNGKVVTLDCLDSLARVSYPNFAVLVIDNASVDGSVQAIREHHPDVTVLRQPTNLRFAGGNNAGIRYALEHNADMVCLLNNDTTVDPQFLTHLVERLQSDPTIGAVAPKIYYHGEPNRIWFAGGEISMWTGTMRHIGIREWDHGQYEASRAIDYATGCCVLTTNKVIERVGMLDESYYMYTEDADWSMRIRRAGYRIVFEPKAKVWHKLSVASGGHLSLYKMANKFVSNLRFFFRYASLPQKFIFPWLNVLVNARTAVKYLLRARDR
ncbi:MAG: glycosyltransferase family 2 protein [Ignavibacteria bacterium]